MKVGRWLIGLSLAGVLLGNPAKGLANDDSASSREFVASDELIIASTDFCYAGTAVDPTTGEAVDFYNLCSDDLDLA
jgi:hypothetical protein